LSKSHPGTEPAGIVLGELPAPSMKPPLLVDNLAAAGATGRQELVWCPHCRSCNSSRSTTVPVSVAGVRIRATSLRWRLTWGRSSAVAIVIEMSAAGPCRCNSADFSSSAEGRSDLQCMSSYASYSCQWSGIMTKFPLCLSYVDNVKLIFIFFGNML
jgi:hypothetical protein